MKLGFAKSRENKFSRRPIKQVEGKLNWAREMEKVSCSLSPSQSLGLILVTVDRLEPEVDKNNYLDFS